MTSDGRLATAVKHHAKDCQKPEFKYFALLQRHQDMPCFLKKKVLDAAVVSALIYGSESWIGCSLKPVERLYNSMVKAMLSVRKSACTDLCLVECGARELQTLVWERQRRYYVKRLCKEAGCGTPLAFMLKLAEEANTPMWRGIQKLRAMPKDFVRAKDSEMRQRIVESSSTKRKLYKVMNPALELSLVYTSVQMPENERVQWTRFRVGSHDFPVEKMRWRGVPLEERFCNCGEVQTEHHILVECPVTEILRRKVCEGVQWTSLTDVFGEVQNQQQVAKMISQARELYS
jgi:hypothetical protein